MGITGLVPLPMSIGLGCLQQGRSIFRFFTITRVPSIVQYEQITCSLSSIAMDLQERKTIGSIFRRGGHRNVERP